MAKSKSSLTKVVPIGVQSPSKQLREQVLDPRKNPFVNQTIEQSTYDKIKVCIMAVTLTPVRFVTILIIAILVFLMAQISLLFASKEVRQGLIPLSDSRKRMQLPCRWLVRLGLFVGGFYWIKTVHYEDDKPAPESAEIPIIISNHISFIDPLYLFASNDCAFVAKAGVRSIPLVGGIAIAFQTMFVERDQSSSKKAALQQIIDRSNNVFPSSTTTNSNLKWKPIAIFPEGTTTNGNSLICFKQGAFAAGVPVKPIIFKYPNKHHDLSWVPKGPGGLTLYLRGISQFVNWLEVHYLPVYYPNDEEKKNPLLYAENVRTWISKKLNIPTTEQTYEDMVLMMESLKEKLPVETVNFEYRQLNKIEEININELKSLLHKFSEFNSSKRGKLDQSEFSTLLGIPNTSSYTKHLFQIFDSDGDEYIDLKEFVSGLCFLSKNVVAKDGIELAFKVFSSTGGTPKTMTGTSLSSSGSLSDSLKLEQVRESAKITQDDFCRILRTCFRIEYP